MNIYYERTGGFAGMHLSAKVELDDLPEEEARRILEMLDAVDFFELPEQLAHEYTTPDEFTYTITVERQSERHTVTTTETGMPNEMHALVEALGRLSRRRRRRTND